jgi:alanyl-tRNA synthetase
MNTQEIRSKFLNYFKKQKHTIVPSSSVIPHDDPTLLFINAGMNQFKDVFLGKNKRDYSRATTSQKCIRVGGKHNDLENVGHTERHLTFFEMLGNFSFGDYFKKEAIRFSWEVSTTLFEFNPEKIWVSVFRDDDEAYELWRPYVPEDRIVRFDEKDNFWSMGETGPCGPCSELYYDRGPNYGSSQPFSENPDNERYLEFWNLVFMQYNKSSSGELELLPNPSIDTGSGLERVVSLVQETTSIFETDIFRNLISKVEELSGKNYQGALIPAFRVISDHLRCLAFAISDGVQPSNLDRGYVLRKVLRRAVRYGRQLGLEKPFLATLLPTLVKEMSEEYKELKINQNRIAEIMTIEEENFIRTLQKGGNRLHLIIEKSKSNISGDDAFLLKDTYGFPLEEIQLIAKDAHLEVDIKRFVELENKAKELSRDAHKKTEQTASKSLYTNIVDKKGVTQFEGYTKNNSEGTVLAIFQGEKECDSLKEGEKGVVILSHTSFYAEQGGQVGDKGLLHYNNNEFNVTNCTSPFTGLIAHTGEVLKGKIIVGETLQTSINSTRRKKIANNHTATHLLHWALHTVLGKHVKQAGSLVSEKQIRFDFNHHKALSQEEIYHIEDLINEKIRLNSSVQNYECSYEKAQKDSDIKQFFGDKYGNVVRVVDIAFSKELCGGTHATQTGTIGYFRIEKESSIAAGVRRIEAVTGKYAETLPRKQEELIDTLSNLTKTTKQKLFSRIEKLLEENKTLQQERTLALKEKEDQVFQELLSHQETLNNISVLIKEVKGVNLRTLADKLLNKMQTGIVLLASATPCQILIKISDNLVNEGHNANEYIKTLAPIISGKGGGKANMAQAGGKKPDTTHLFETFKTLLTQS